MHRGAGASRGDTIDPSLVARCTPPWPRRSLTRLTTRLAWPKRTRIDPVPKHPRTRPVVEGSFAIGLATVPAGLLDLVLGATLTEGNFARPTARRDLAGWSSSSVLAH